MKLMPAIATGVGIFCCTIWLGYALFYFTRKSFNAAVPEILAKRRAQRSDIGLLATPVFTLTYGVVEVCLRHCQRSLKCPLFYGDRLIATGSMNILFGFSTSLWAFAVLWVLNAFFQGWGSPVCARLLTAWYSRTERGGWWALWNTAHNVGGALIPIVMAASALHYGWRADGDCWLYGDSRGDFSLLAATRSARRR